MSAVIRYKNMNNYQYSSKAARVKADPTYETDVYGDAYQTIDNPKQHAFSDIDTMVMDGSDMGFNSVNSNGSAYFNIIVPSDCIGYGNADYNVTLPGRNGQSVTIDVKKANVTELGNGLALISVNKYETSEFRRQKTNASLSEKYPYDNLLTDRYKSIVEDVSLNKLASRCSKILNGIDDGIYEDDLISETRIYVSENADVSENHGFSPYHFLLEQSITDIQDMKQCLIVSEYNKLVGKYNKILNFANVNSIPLPKCCFDDDRTPSIDGNSKLKEDMEGLYCVCDEYSKEHVVSPDVHLPNLFNYSHHEGYSKDPYVALDMFNAKRGLSFDNLPAMIQDGDKLCPTTYEGYIFSTHELAQLMKGESIIAANIPVETSEYNSEEHCIMTEVSSENRVIKLDPKIGMIQHVGTVSLNSEAFRNEDINEAYALDMTMYDMFADIHKGMALTASARLEERKNTPVRTVNTGDVIRTDAISRDDVLELTKDLKERVKVNCGWDGDEYTHGKVSRDYYLSQWPLFSKDSVKLVYGKRSTDLLQFTRDKYESVNPSKKGERMGFANAYEERAFDDATKQFEKYTKLFDEHISYVESKLAEDRDSLSKISISDESAELLDSATKYLDTLKQYRASYVKDSEEHKVEKELREDNDISDESKAKGFVSKWDEKVASDYETAQENGTLNAKISSQYASLMRRINASAAKASQNSVSESVPTIDT